MQKLLFLALVCVGMMMFGCISTPNVTEAGDGAQNASEVNPFTAKEGLSDATTAMHALWGDGYLVSVYSNCDGNGRAMEWQYSFDSPARKKGYVVAVPGDGMIRDKPFSFSNGLKDQWVDSNAAVTACGKSGECSLEITDGKPIWTIVSGTEICEVDALNGKVLG
jgi:hypothetical protein